MVIDIRMKEQNITHSTLINGEQIQLVTHYKYLGIVLDHKLKWDVWTDFLSKKIQQRLYFFKKLMSFNVHSGLLLMFYGAFIESIMTFCVSCLYGNASEAQKKSLRNVRTTISQMLGIKLTSIESIYKESMLSKANIIVNDEASPFVCI